MSDVRALHVLHELLLSNTQANQELTSQELRDRITLSKGRESQYPDADRVSPWLYQNTSNFS